MYAGNAAFAEAIRDRRAQHMLALFPSFCLTDEDVSVDGGIQYNEYLNTDEDITMGKALQSEVSLSLINRDGCLSELDFTQSFALRLGVETTSEYVPHTIPSGYDLAIIMDADGIAVQVYASTTGRSVVCGTTSYAVSASPRALLAHDRKLYVAGENGLIAVYELRDNGTLTALALPALNDMMSAKFRRWAQEKRCACLEGYTLREYSDIAQPYYTWGELLALTWSQVKERTWGELLPTTHNRASTRTSSGTTSRMRRKTTEYVPLGVFTGERPEKLRTRLIELNAYDNMVKFEREAEGFFDSLTYPITLRAYFEALCAYCGVVPTEMTRFINGDKTFTSAPINTNGLTCRDVLARLAEAACSYARINRDGACELAWFAETEYVVRRTDRFALDRAEYEVMPIDRTQVKVTENDIGVLVGSGNNGYAVVDCPFLYGMTDADVRPWAENIHNELVRLGAYSPMTVDAECDWRVQCGDIITVEEDDGTLHKTPVFVQTITWNGHANVTYESTGRVRREEMNQQQREQIRTSRAWYEIKKTIEGLVSSVGKVESFDERITECESLIKQTSSSITAAVSKSEQALSTASGLETRVSTAEQKITADAIISTVTSQTTFVNAQGVRQNVGAALTSQINQTANQVKISAPHIALEGIVTSNGNVKIDAQGNIECKNGKFNGTLTAGYWTFNSNGSEYDNGTIGVNMTVMNGNFVGGGTSTRAFYGSRYCDVQYGADYGYNTFIRSKAITIVAHNNGNMQDYRMATFSKYPGSKGYEDFTFYCNESESQESPSGNIGYDAQPWDTIYVRKVMRKEESTYSSKYVKHDIDDLPEIGDLIDKLRPVSFKYNGKSDRTHYGLIVEDVVEVFPVICTVPDAEEGSDDYKNGASISYTDLIAPMLKEIQSLRKRVMKLEANAV